DYHIIFPGDNLHASRTEPHLSIDNTPVINSNFSSSGCLTVTGQPEEYVRSSYSFFWNSWEQFMKLLVSSSSKQKYTLLLFNFSDLTGIGKNGQHTILRFGSQGSQVTELQSILSEIYSTKTDSPYYTGSHDGLLEADTARAWLRFMNDYSPGSIKGETDINEFRSKTSHFIFTIKRYEHVIY
ncbi:MAG: hypothetical protein PHH93_09605, partial [Prolixibacteraceae bacterium]|nr:hypothetical protein [Prolixibacteraceae bacterium]